MSRIRLKCGGRKRHKAIFGADGAVMAAATLAAAGMNVAATNKAANQQAKAMVDNAKTQGEVMKQQITNDNEMLKQNMSFTRQQNEENRKQQQDIQNTLQIMAGQQNMNERLEANKKVLKCGGSAKRRRKLKGGNFLYGGANFAVTDGGSAQIIGAYNDGILYELKGNDHEHYHKTNGKYKSGVGVKIKGGEVIEGEGDQGTGRGEYIFDDGNDLKFISKHSIKGFNPREAVNNGVHPKRAFDIQERIKDNAGIKDDGSKAKCGTRKSIRSKAITGLSIPIKANVAIPNSLSRGNNTFNLSVGNANIRVPAKLSRISTPVGGINARGSSNFWNNYGGAIMNSGANLLGAGLSWMGNAIANNKLSKARNQAANIMVDYIDQMHGIDMSKLNQNDYKTAHAIAAIRDPNVNVNPQIENIRRQARSETREINRNTLSSAARLNRIAGSNSRAYQKIGEQYSYKTNAEEQGRQENMKTLTQVAITNADRDAQSRQAYGRDRLALLQHNNAIENQKLSLKGQVLSDAKIANATDYSTMMNSGMTGLSSSIAASGQAFGSAFDANKVFNQNMDMVMFGADTASKVDYAIEQATKGNTQLAEMLFKSFYGSSNPNAKAYANRLRKVLI